LLLSQRWGAGGETETAQPADTGGSDGPVTMPAPDEGTRQGFLAAYEAGAGCSYATRISSGIDAGKLEVVAVESGSFVVGRIRDVRGRALWLALVTVTGEVFDLSSRLQAQPDGSATFEFGMGLGANAPAAAQVLVALAASDPVLSLAAITDGEPADKVMPLILNEIAAKQGGAAASLGWVLLTPEGG